jgi:Na+/proline symporter
VKNVLRIGGYALVVLLVLAGGLALSKVVKFFLGAPFSEPVSTVIIGLGFLVLGYALFLFLRLNYRGGASSIIGGFFVLAGIWNLSNWIETGQLSNVRETIPALLAAAVLVAGGYLLLKHGHERHRRLSENGAT